LKKVISDTIKSVAEFTYLGSLLTYDNVFSKEVGRRIGKATEV